MNSSKKYNKIILLNRLDFSRNNQISGTNKMKLNKLKKKSKTIHKKI